MRFTLIDRILELEQGSTITAVKTVSLAEEYLADHFPRFPVLPGVLMLEAMVQAGSWLVRASEDFAHSMVVLQEARNVKYGSFVRPSQSLVINAQIKEHKEFQTRIDARGSVEGNSVVSARLTLERYNLADREANSAETDRVLVRHAREMYRLLYPLSPAAA